MSIAKKKSGFRLYFGSVQTCPSIWAARAAFGPHAGSWAAYDPPQKRPQDGLEEDNLHHIASL